MMSPVGAHDQVVLPDIVHEVGKVFPLLVRAIETVLLEQSWPPLFRTSPEDAPQRVEHVRNPGRASLDEAEPQLGKELGNLVGDEIPKGHQRKGTRVGKGVAPCHIEDGGERRTSGSRVDADGHIEAGRLRVHREKKRVGQGAVLLQCPEEYSDRAMAPCAVDLLYAGADGAQ